MKRATWHSGTFAGDPLGVEPAPYTEHPPRSSLLRGYLWAACRCGLRLAPTSALAYGEGGPAASDPARATTAGSSSHSSIAFHFGHPGLQRRAAHRNDNSSPLSSS